MNIEDLQQEWKLICSKVKEYPGVDSSQVNAFFARLQLQAMSDDFIMITTDAEFIKNYIETHYMDLIKKALKDLYGASFTVALEVDPNQKSVSPQTSQQKAENTQQTDAPSMPSAVSPAEPEASPQVITNEQKPAQPVPLERAEKAAESKHLADMPFKMTFENFVIGDSNNLAFSMAVAVAEQPGKMPGLNPLFIYGKSGLGKTHLLSSIQNYIADSSPELTAVYADSSEFLNQYIEASIEHDRDAASYRNFKQRYTSADVLLIDDVQFFQAKHQTLDILFQIFNTFIDEGKQVVLAADRAPKNIDLDERYSSRFAGGMVCAINPPEIDTKMGIIRSFVEEYRIARDMPDFSIPPKIEQYIADISSSNIRELKGAVSIVVYHMNANKDITVDDVRELLKNQFSGGANKKISISDIQKQVEAFYKVSHADLVGNKRSREIVYPRKVAIYLCRQMLDLPYKYIGSNFGGRDHTTVMYSYDSIEEKLKESREVQEEIESIKTLIWEN